MSPSSANFWFNNFLTHVSHCVHLSCLLILVYSKNICPRHPGIEGDFRIGFLPFCWAPPVVLKPHPWPLQVVDTPSNGLIKDGFRSGWASWFRPSDACAFRFSCFRGSGVSWHYGLICALCFCSFFWGDITWFQDVDMGQDTNLQAAKARWTISAPIRYFL